MKCMFLCNPNSGKGKILKKIEYILLRLHERFEVVEHKITTSRQNLLDETKQACKNFDVLVFAGGDGTVNDVVNVVKKCDSKIILGYIPSGTCNDFARSLKIPKKLNKALDVIVQGVETDVDGFCANGRFGVYVCTSGIFTSASYDTQRKSKKHFGKLSYYFHSIKEIFSAKSLGLKYRLDDGEWKKEESVLFLMMNSSSVAGWKINKKSDVHDGKMDFVSIKTNKKNKKLSFKALLVIAQMFLFGLESVKKYKSLSFGQFEKATLSTKSNSTINIDGENGGNGKLDIFVCKNMFKMFVKKLKNKKV